MRRASRWNSSKNWLAMDADLPTTYAGGIRDLGDLQLMREAGKGSLDCTVGSALDIFGGKTLTYREAVHFCRSTENRHDRCICRKTMASAA